MGWAGGEFIDAVQLGCALGNEDDAGGELLGGLVVASALMNMGQGKGKGKGKGKHAAGKGTEKKERCPVCRGMRACKCAEKGLLTRADHHAWKKPEGAVDGDAKAKAPAKEASTASAP